MRWHVHHFQSILTYNLSPMVIRIMGNCHSALCHFNFRSNECISKPTNIKMWSKYVSLPLPVLQGTHGMLIITQHTRNPLSTHFHWCLAKMQNTLSGKIPFLLKLCTQNAACSFKYCTSVLHSDSCCNTTAASSWHIFMHSINGLPSTSNRVVWWGVDP